MSTRRAPVKPVRRCHLSAGEGNSRRILTLFVAKEAFLYFLAAIACDYGRGFALEKFEGGEVYHVHFDKDMGDSCTCLGFLRHRHCKHRDALAALMAAGRL
jgi:hypothetical protein